MNENAIHGAPKRLRMENYTKQSLRIASYPVKNPKKQPPSNPKPLDSRTIQKRKAPNYKSKPESRPTTKQPNIKFKHPQLQPTPPSPPKPQPRI